MFDYINKYEIKKTIGMVISVIPSNFLRILLYRSLFKYKIDSSAKIGYLTIIAVDRAIVKEKVNIGKQNLFWGPYKLEIDAAARMGNKNELICDDWVLDNKFENCGYFRECKIGRNTLINHDHFIDVVGKFELQDNSWIAGRNSQFWTHGGWVGKNSIIIGQNCYIGSAVKFAPGAKIGNNTLVGMGSVVSKEFDIDNALIAGVPGKVIKENYDWKSQTTISETVIPEPVTTDSGNIEET